MEIILTTTFNAAALSASGGLKSAVRPTDPAHAPRHVDAADAIRPCLVHGEPVEGYKRGTIIARYLWSSSERAPEGWWKPSEGPCEPRTLDTSADTMPAAASPPGMELLLGRDAGACDVVVPLRLQHGPLFSRRHCALRVSLASASTASEAAPPFGTCVMRVVDLDSRNGTFVNGVRVGSTTTNTATATKDTMTDAPAVSFHPTIDTDIATGIAPVLTLAFGTGAAVSIGGELPDDALRVRFHVYVRVLWRTAAWELGRLLTKPHPRLGVALTATTNPSPMDTEEYTNEDGQDGTAHMRDDLASAWTGFVMHDRRGRVHRLQPPMPDGAGVADGADGDDDEATQDDWLDEIRHSFDGDDREARPTAAHARTTHATAVHDGEMSSEAALRADVGLQWWVNQLGGEPSSREHEAPADALASVDLSVEDGPPSLSSSSSSLLMMTERDSVAPPRASPERTPLTPAATRPVVPETTAHAAQTARRSLHTLTRAIVAQHAAIGADGLVRPTTLARPPSPSLSPVRDMAPSMEVRFSHMLTDSRGEPIDISAAPDDVAPQPHTDTDDDALDAPVLVRSRRASDRRPIPVVSSTHDGTDVIRSSPPASQTSPSRPPAEPLSSQPPRRRSVSLPQWATPTHSEAHKRTPDKSSPRFILAPASMDEAEYEEVIEVAVTPPPEAVTVVVDEEAEHVATRQSDESSHDKASTASMATTKKKLSKKQQKVVDASETIARFMQELQGPSSPAVAADTAPSEERLSPLFFHSTKTTTHTTGPHLHSWDQPEARHALDVLTQLEQDVFDDAGAHVHVCRRPLRQHRRHAEQVGAAPTSAAPVDVAKTLAAALRAGLALGEAPKKTHSSESDEDVALDDLLALSASPSKSRQTTLGTALAEEGVDQAHAVEKSGDIEDNVEDSRPTVQLQKQADLTAAIIDGRPSDAEGRPTSSTTHLSPRVSFDGAHHRATIAPLASLKEAEKIAETWCVFITTPTPLGSTHRQSRALPSARSSSGAVLGHDVEEEEEEVCPVLEAPLCQRRTLQEMLTQQGLDDMDGGGEEEDDDNNDHTAVRRGGDVSEAASRAPHGAAESFSQYTTERAWILTCAGALDDSVSANASAKDTDEDGDDRERGDRHARRASARTSALFQGSPRYSGTLPPVPTSTRPVKGRKSKSARHSTTQTTAAALPPLSQLLSLDVQAYLFAKDTHDASLPVKTPTVRQAKSAAKRVQTANEDAPLFSREASDLCARPVPLLRLPRQASSDTQKREAVGDNNMGIAQRMVTRTPQALVGPFTGTALSGEEPIALPGLPPAVARALYPHQRAAVRFLWHAFLPSSPAPLSSDSGAAPMAWSRLLSSRARGTLSTSERRKRGRSGGGGYRPLITVSDIADILDAHHPPKPPSSHSSSVSAATRSLSAELSASQLFGHEHVQARVSQLTSLVDASSRDRDHDRRLTEAVDDAEPTGVRGVILAHAAGLGKTVTVIAFLIQLWCTRPQSDVSSLSRPSVFHSRTDDGGVGGAGGVRTVLCVPKQGLHQWTRTLDTWLALAGRGTGQVFVLHQEGRRYDKAHAAMLEEWAASGESGALLLITHTCLASLFSTSGTGGADARTMKDTKVVETRAARKKPTTAKASPRPSTPPPLQESFWVDEMTSSEDAEDSEAVSALAPSAPATPVRHAGTLSKAPRGTHVHAEATLLGGGENEKEDENAAEESASADAVKALEAEEALTQYARTCRSRLITHTTLLIVDEADRLTDTAPASAKAAHAAKKTSPAVALSHALAQFPADTARIALTSRLPSLLLVRADHGPARASLCGLLRFVDAQRGLRRPSAAQLLARYREAQGELRTTLKQRCMAAPCAMTDPRLAGDVDGDTPRLHHREEDEQEDDDDDKTTARTPSTVTRASPPAPPSLPWYALTSARRADARPVRSPSTHLSVAPTGLLVDECLPAEVAPHALPVLVETTLVFDLSPVQMAMLRELVRDLSTDSCASSSPSSPSSAVRGGGDGGDGADEQRHGFEEAMAGTARQAQKNKPTPSSRRATTRPSSRATGRVTTATTSRATLNPSAAAQAACADGDCLPSTSHPAFTTYALYISNQCDLVRDWCQRQGLNVNTSVQDVEAHERRCAGQPTRRARWAIPSLLTPSVFDQDADADADESQSHATPACMAALEYSWKMRGLFFLLHRALARGEKVVVFSHSLKTLVLIAWLMDQGNHLVDGTDFALVSGALSIRQRDRLYTTFNDPASPLAVLLLTFEIAHSGIDLHGADRVVLFDASRSADAEVQAVTRTFRLHPSSTASSAHASPPSAPIRTTYVNRFLSNEPVEIQSLPMATLQALALRVISAPALATPSTEQPVTKKTKREPTQAGEVAFSLFDFVHDVARLDVRTGFSACFASALAQKNNETALAALPTMEDEEEETGRSCGRATTTTTRVDTSHHPRHTTSRASAAPLRTLSRALASTGAFAGLTSPITARPSRSSSSSPAPPPPPSPSTSSSSSMAARLGESHRRRRSATPPPPPLPCRRTLTPGLTVCAVLESYFAEVPRTDGLGDSLLVALPSVWQCTASADETVGDTAALSSLSPRHGAAARYVVPAMLAYLQLTEARRRQRLRASPPVPPPSRPTSLPTCTSANATCQDPVVAELVSMEEMRDILALHFHENRIWNTLNGIL